jgi:hypothetical protein
MGNDGDISDIVTVITNQMFSPSSGLRCAIVFSATDHFKTVRTNQKAVAVVPTAREPSIL